MGSWIPAGFRCPICECSLSIVRYDAFTSVSWKNEQCFAEALNLIPSWGCNETERERMRVKHGRKQHSESNHSTNTSQRINLGQSSRSISLEELQLIKPRPSRTQTTGSDVKLPLILKAVCQPDGESWSHFALSPKLWDDPYQKSQSALTIKTACSVWDFHRYNLCRITSPEEDRLQTCRLPP